MDNWGVADLIALSDGVERMLLGLLDVRRAAASDVGVDKSRMARGMVEVAAGFAALPARFPTPDPYHTGDGASLFDQPDTSVTAYLCQRFVYDFWPSLLLRNAEGEQTHAADVVWTVRRKLSDQQSDLWRQTRWAVSQWPDLNHPSLPDLLQTELDRAVERLSILNLQTKGLVPQSPGLAECAGLTGPKVRQLLVRLEAAPAGVPLADLNRVLTYPSAEQPGDTLLRLVSRSNQKLAAMKDAKWTISRFTRRGVIHFRLVNQQSGDGW